MIKVKAEILGHSTTLLLPETPSVGDSVFIPMEHKEVERAILLAAKVYHRSFHHNQAMPTIHMAPTQGQLELHDLENYEVVADD